MLNYTMNKNIVIEARESCRVPVPVERCPLFKREEEKDDDDQNSEFFLTYSSLTIKQIESLIVNFHLQITVCVKAMLT